jgi:hypothetical protein
LNNPQTDNSKIIFPPKELLKLAGVEKEKPQIVNCELCKEKGCERLLFVKYGAWAFFFDSKGKDRYTGEPRGLWVQCKSIVCEHGHYTAIVQETKAVEGSLTWSYPIKTSILLRSS